MNCSKCQKLYDAAVQGDLPEKLSRKVREHLDSCPTCSVVWQENDALRSLVRETGAPASVPDADYFRQLARQTAAQVESERGPAARPTGRWLDGLAALLGGPQPVMLRLTRATALLAVGAIIGLGASQGLKTGALDGVLNPVRPTARGGLATRTPLITTAVPIVEPTVGPVILVARITPETGSFAVQKTPDPRISATRVSDEPPITKFGSAEPFAVDPTLLWQQTVNLLDKLPELDEVEQLRRVGQVTRRVKAGNVLTSLQGLKLQLVRSGQTEYIPVIHSIEEVFNELAAASPESAGAHFAQLDTYQDAWRALIEKRYEDATRLFRMVVVQSPGSYFAALATYQVGNINFEHYRNYKDALFDYNKCLNESPPHFLSKEIQDQIHGRVELISQNTVDDYAPLRAYYKAAAVKEPAEAVAHYATVVRQYPQSSLVEQAITAMSRIARQAADDDDTLGRQVLDELLQFMKKNPGHAAGLRARLGVADVYNYCLRNRSQAALEYSEILEKAKDPDLIRGVRMRLRMLERER